MNVGDTINCNDYEYLIREAIDDGGKSQSYRASRGSNEVFLKRLINQVYPAKRGGLSDEAYRKKLLSAGLFEKGHRDIMALLDEPVVGGGNLVKPLDMFRLNGNFYKVYPFIKAKSSSSISSLKPNAQAIFVRTLLLCVFELHLKNIVHGDLKPENILVNRRAVTVARLIDFDDAYMSRQPPRASRISGDAVYYSPEHFEYADRGGDPNRMTTKSDIFSLALVLLKIITGHHQTWRGGSGDSPAELVLSGAKPNKPSSLSGFSNDFVNAVLGALCVDPNDRPTITELLRTVDVDVGHRASHLDKERVPPRPTDAESSENAHRPEREERHDPATKSGVYFSPALARFGDETETQSTGSGIEINFGRGKRGTRR